MLLIYYRKIHVFFGIFNPKPKRTNSAVKNYLFNFKISQSYQKAIMDLNKPSLKSMLQAGVPGAWIADAIITISGSVMPQADKRKRLASIFSDHAQPARAFAADNPTPLEVLVNWLPLEDSWPIFPIAPTEFTAEHLLEPAYKKAQKDSREDLACNIKEPEELSVGNCRSQSTVNFMKTSKH